MNIENDKLFDELMDLNERELKRLVARLYGFIQWKQEDQEEIDPDKLMHIMEVFSREKEKQQA